MRTYLNQRSVLSLLLAVAIAHPVAGQTTAQATGIAATVVEDEATQPEHPWTLVPSFSWSFFNKGRDSWQQENLELYYYLAQEKLLFDASVERMHRPPNGYDTVYGFGAAWYPSDQLELHGGIKLTDDAGFLPSERYDLGFQYRWSPQWEVLLDVEQMNFGSYARQWNDGITQVKPGLRYWFSESNSLTLRYTHGWVHDAVDYDYYGVDVTFGDLPRDAKLVLSLAYGTDPDLDFGTGSTSLSDAYMVSIFYKQPVSADLTTFFGLEYVYRLRADNDDELYQMWTPTIGLSWKF